MPISELTAKEISTNIDNYLKQKKSEGGKYSLAELRREMVRRNGVGVSGRDVVGHILSLCKKHADGLITYKDLHGALHPGQDWKGHGSLKKITQALDAAIYYCYDNNLPVVTVLVINGADRRLTEQAKQSIFEVCRGLGFKTGNDADSYVEGEIVRSRRLVEVGFPASARVRDRLQSDDHV